jgi:membrane protease YdiL (CAAX protease family)
LPWLVLGRFGWSGAAAAGTTAVVVGGVAMAAAMLLGYFEAGSCALVHHSARSPWAYDPSAPTLVEQGLLAGLMLAVSFEPLFRGALQERLTASLGLRPAIAVQGVAYAAHLFLSWSLVWSSRWALDCPLRSLAWAVVGLVAGLLLGLLRALSGGLFAPMVACTFAGLAVSLASSVAR